MKGSVSATGDTPQRPAVPPSRQIRPRRASPLETADVAFPAFCDEDRRSATSPAMGTSRLVRSSETRARAGVRLVDSRGVALRDTRGGDVKDIRDRAGVDDLIHFPGSLDERLPRAVRGGLALATDRSVNGELTLLDDDDRASRMGVPARGAARDDRDLRHGYVSSDLKRDGPI